LKKFIFKLLPLIDLLLAIPAWLAAGVLKAVRRIGVHRLPVCRRLLLSIGVFPIRNHYYEPQFDYRNKRQSFRDDRVLPGIDWNLHAQLTLLATFNHTDELVDLPQEKPDKLEFYLQNESFLSGDAEYWYQIIRTFKPARIFEVGSGSSTLMAIRAIQKNRLENPQYECKHVCIEPYEQPWLEETGVDVRRTLIEDIDFDFFTELTENDILFIDSSHIIRPQGDVLFEYLELLPRLNKGVIVHVHDIFSPKNYLTNWLEDQVLFWNEQYLLEAFLSHNQDWKILGALNFLHHNHYKSLKAVAPYLTPNREPGSFYMQKINPPDIPGFELG
jgi:hypothetical protein